ncbi:MAG: DMT family transporter [Spirochaetota bacterium]|nr:DMT family transporter [Spirochaetota bacterium]
MRENTRSFVCAFGLIFVTIIWGFAFVVVKNSLDYVPPLYMMAFRFTIASFVLALLFLPKFKHLDKSTFFHGMILGIFLFAAYAFQTVGLQFTTAGKNAFLTTTYVMMVPFLNWFFHKSKPSWNCVLAAIIALAGIGLLSLQGDFSMNRGDVLTIICGFFFAVHIIFISRYTQTQDPVLLTILQLAFSALFSWIFAPFTDRHFPLQETLRADVIVSMLYLGLFSTLLCFLLQNVCQKYLRASTTSLLLSFESVFGVIFSIIFLKEILTAKMIVGCMLIFFALVLSEIDWKQKKLQ